MTKFSALLCLFLISGSAHAISGDSSPAEWNRASSGDKRAWVGDAVAAINARSGRDYTSGEILSCINSALRPPVSAGMAQMTVGEVAVSCFSMLKR